MLEGVGLGRAGFVLSLKHRQWHGPQLLAVKARDGILREINGEPAITLRQQPHPLTPQDFRQTNRASSSECYLDAARCAPACWPDIPTRVSELETRAVITDRFPLACASPAPPAQAPDYIPRKPIQRPLLFSPVRRGRLCRFLF